MIPQSFAERLALALCLLVTLSVEVLPLFALAWALAWALRAAGY